MLTDCSTTLQWAVPKYGEVAHKRIHYYYSTFQKQDASYHSHYIILYSCSMLISSAFNPCTAMVPVPSLGKQPVKNAKLEIMKAFFTLRMSTWKDLYQNAQDWKQICYKTIKYTVCRTVCVHFSAWAGAVKGLKTWCVDGSSHLFGTLGSGARSVVEHQDSWSKGHRSVWVPAGAVGEFSSSGSNSCADPYFGIHSTPMFYHSSAWKLPVILSKVQLAGYTQTLLNLTFLLKMIHNNNKK